MRPELLLIPAAFLAGSIPFGLLIGLAKGVDVRHAGSGNIGATNVGRVLGRRYFFLCFTLDAAKGFLPTLAAGWYMGVLGWAIPSPAEAWVWLGTMGAAVLGHVFSPWLGGKGGKGVATGAGALAGVYPIMTAAALLAAGIWLATIGIWRYVSLSSLISGLSLPVIVWVLLCLRSPDGAWTWSRVQNAAEAGHPFLVVAVLLAGLVVWTHRANIRRLRTGTESKFF